MNQRTGLSNLLIAGLMVASLSFEVACSDDGKDGAATGGTSNGGSTTGGSATSGNGGANAAGGKGGGAGVDVDFTQCVEQMCDPDAKLDFDFTGSWHESLIFTSNDCGPGIQPLLPKDFMQPDTVFSDVVVGNCVRPQPDSDIYTGVIAADLSGANYCTMSVQHIENPEADLELVNHVTWDSIEPNKITGKSTLYVKLAGCKMVGDYSLTR